MWSSMVVCLITLTTMLVVGSEAQNPVVTNQIQPLQGQPQPGTVFSPIVQQQQQQQQQQPQMQLQFQQPQQQQLQQMQPIQQPQQNMASPFQMFFRPPTLNNNNNNNQVPFPVQAQQFQQSQKSPQQQIMEESFPILTRIVSAFRQAFTGNKQQQQQQQVFNQQQQQFLPVQQQQQQTFFPQSNAIVQPMQASNMIFDVVPPTTRKPINLFGDLFG